MTEAELAAWSNRWRDHVRELERRGWIARIQQVPVIATRAVVAVAGPTLLDTQRDAVEAIDRRRRHVRAIPAARRHRQRQDRGLPAHDRARRRTGPTGTRTRSRDRLDAATHRALCRALRCAARRAAFGAHGSRAAAGLARRANRSGTGRDRHALRRVCTARASRFDRRRRGTRCFVQAAGGIPLLGARPRVVASATVARCPSCWAPRRRRSKASIASTSTRPSRCCCRNERPARPHRCCT